MPQTIPLRSILRQALADRRTKIAVIDDDPTGTQGVADVPVVSRWEDEDLDWAIATSDELFFVLTNTRSMDEPAAVAINRTVGERLARRAAAHGVEVRCVSRSDSTLRGHFPAEVEALAAGLRAGGRTVDAIVLCPAFLRAGRITVGDVHYLRAEDGALVPVAETEFARDRTFGYRSSNLIDWAVERGVDRARVTSLSLDLLRDGGPEAVSRRLAESAGRIVVANAEEVSDLETLALGIDLAERDGLELLYRTGPSFVAARAGQEERAPLEADEVVPLPGPGLVVVGSHTELTTRQLAAASAAHPLGTVELDVAALIEGEPEVARCAARLTAALRGGNAALVTSRTLRTGASSEESLRIAGRVAGALVEIVRSIPAAQPLGWVLAKGGITSSDIAAIGFDARRARVVGQVFPGLVSVWRLDASSARPELPYVVFPGNVGDVEALKLTLDRLAAACR